MPKICYVERRFSPASLKQIEQANAIITEYEAQGFELTLRQLYYQFVARDLIPNTMRSYKNLGSIINDARLAGLIDWNSIVDRTRNLVSNSHWNHPGEIVEACARQFQIDKWENQEYRPEVWIEKDALAGVIERVCRGNDVAFFSCRGYTSQSEMWSAAQRLLQYVRNGQSPYIIHLGDHDPSGIDMSRDIEDRLTLFMRGKDLTVERIALNMDQIEHYNPPPNPAKTTDARAADYIQKYGEESWELDALEPKVLEELIQEKIDALRESSKWEDKKEEENKFRQDLSETADELRDRYE